MTKGLLRFNQDISELERLAPELEQFGEKASLPARMVIQLQLVLEELLTNTLHYGAVKDETLWLEVALEQDEDMLIITIRDNAVPFDPTGNSPVDTSSALEDRQIGGLGLHIVTSMVDELAYKREGVINELILTFYLADRGVT